MNCIRVIFQNEDILYILLIFSILESIQRPSFAEIIGIEWVKKCNFLSFSNEKIYSKSGKNFSICFKFFFSIYWDISSYSFYCNKWTTRSSNYSNFKCNIMHFNLSKKKNLKHFRSINRLFKESKNWLKKSVSYNLSWNNNNNKIIRN